MKLSLPARLSAEFPGTAFLVAAVIGSGITAERLSGGNVAIAPFGLAVIWDAHAAPHPLCHTQ
ncbi:MAG TPA: hypothetical protein VJK27_12120 [Terriglobales bacterium]|nr:hypothetical protein [Terriglobales bacterium]